jgi:hypothetical protein
MTRHLASTLRVFVLFLFLILSFNRSAASDDFTWAPVTDADLAVKPDSAHGGMHAVMIFEKVTIDDRGFEDGDLFFEVYRRIKVFTPAGRSWAEVSLPFIRKREAILDLMARTVLPDGRVIVLDEDQVHESERVKTEDLRIMQKSFSFPGVTDGSIIEYRYRHRGTSFNNQWKVQKDIPLLKTELTWKFITRIDNFYLRSVYSRLGLTPNYLSLNLSVPWKVDVLPSKEDPQELRFTLDAIPGFKSESYTLADDILKAQLICYYSKGNTTAEFWKMKSEDKQKEIDEFNDDHDALQDILKGFETVTGKSQRLLAAYTWVTSHIKNVNTFADDTKLKPNKDLSDVIDHGYGTTQEINLLFHALAQEMKYETRMVYLVDNRDDRFIKGAKYWQFDCSVVYVEGDGGVPLFYAPGYRFMPPGLVPWYTEGTEGLFVGNKTGEFFILPASPATVNRIGRKMTLRLDSTLALHGTVREETAGQAARSVRMKLADTEGNVREEQIRKKLNELCPHAEVDSVTFAGVDSLGTPCVLSGSVSIPPLETQSAKKMLLHPFMIMATEKSPFTPEKRVYPIVMEYAWTRTERIAIELPLGWAVESLPKPVAFENKIGKVTLSAVAVGNRVNFDRVMTLNQAFWQETDYAEVQGLYSAYERLEDLAAVLAGK